MNIQDRHLIDRYLQGELSGIELDHFKKRMRAEETFRSEVELQEVVYAGIRHAHHDRLQSLVKSSLNYRRPRVPAALKMIVAFFLLTGIGISFWLYIGPESSNRDQSKSWFAFLNSRKADPAGPPEKSFQKDLPRTAPPARQVPEEKQDPASTVDDTLQGAALVADPLTDSVANAPVEEEIIVKQDQLLISATLSVEEKIVGSGSDKQESLSGEAVEKMNPGADLPEVEKLPANYLVEYWVSPINYKGYKMSKNKLILFGIEEPDAVKLYRVNDTLYMNYLDEFYRLQNSFDFLSYQKLKDSEIPLAIK